jgi:hypothetical protein
MAGTVTGGFTMNLADAVTRPSPTHRASTVWLVSGEAVSGTRHVIVKAPPSSRSTVATFSPSQVSSTDPGLVCSRNRRMSGPVREGSSGAVGLSGTGSGGLCESGVSGTWVQCLLCQLSAGASALGDDRTASFATQPA